MVYVNNLHNVLGGFLDDKSSGHGRFVWNNGNEYDG